MSTYKDLSKYSYYAQDHISINIGWLGLEDVITVKSYDSLIDSEFMEKLLFLCTKRRVHISRGLHICEHCNINKDTGEIRVFSKDKTYAAPTMIYHYIKHHGYIPPKEFVLAVKHSSPSSEEYKKQLLDLNITYKEIDNQSMELKNSQFKAIEDTENRLKNTEEVSQLNTILEKHGLKLSDFDKK